MRLLHFVCDVCGHYWQALDATLCPECSRTRIWEFGKGRHALEHVSHINRVRVYGTLRGAS